jgi:DNA modification methylase
MTNTLYYGDNLDILKRYIKDETVDLVYLDPPFNSNANYNVLFAEQDGARAAAQVKAFEDTWEWNQESAKAFQEIVEGGGQVSQAMQAFRMMIGDNNMLAYLSMMAPRLVELRRVMKPTASIYLHCDPTAGHYLKLLMDAIFGAANFKNEIVWQRSGPKGLSYNRFPSTHDLLLVYSKSSDSSWNKIFGEYKVAHLAKFRYIEEGSGRRYMMDNVQNPNPDRPNLRYEWNGVTKVWRWTKDKMQQMEDTGRLVYSKTGVPYYKRYLDEMPGATITDTWTDIAPINSQAKERLGYPTQKPEGLLERIIKAGSNEGDLVLDPFCGCGTAIAVAQRLNRQWIGIDITHLAITLMKHRLKDMFGDQVQYQVIGEPVSLPDAEMLAQQDPYQFQWWALGLVGARPAEQKKGSDKGIDGRIYFHDDSDSKTKQVILSVKAGHTNVAHVRDLRGVLDREKAEIGVLISMQEPTGPMQTEAVGAGFYSSPVWGKSYPKLQILTIAELLSGKGIDMPPLKQVAATFKKAPKAKGEEIQTLPMALEEQE